MLSDGDDQQGGPYQEKSGPCTQLQLTGHELKAEASGVFE
jgi:hypothetical protein